MKHVIILSLMAMSMPAIAADEPAKKEVKAIEAKATDEQAVKTIEAQASDAKASLEKASTEVKTSVTEVEAGLKTVAKETAETTLDLRDPEQLIKDTSSALLGQIRTEQGDAKPLSELHTLITKELMPYVAQKTIARKVLGKHWKKANTDQKAKFMDEFSTFLILFYAKAFSQYNDEKITYLPVGKSKSKKIATVKSQIALKNNRPLNVNYKLRQRKSGEWRVVDIIVEGVSLVVSKQKEYTRLVSQEGLDTVIAKLEQNNKQSLTGE